MMWKNRFAIEDVFSGMGGRWLIGDEVGVVRRDDLKVEGWFCGR